MPNEINRESFNDLKFELKEELQRIVDVQTKQYDKIDVKLDIMNSALIKAESKYSQQEKQLDNLEHIINGNGRPGLKAQVLQISQHMDRFDSEITELKQAVTSGFEKISNRQDSQDKKENELKDNISTTKTKIIIALLGSALTGGTMLKVIELLI